jgi:UDP-N-acetylmuramoyl-tripeptide--D-alanyl-D-alanine ligase
MGEVGDQGPAFHREVGEYARAAGVNRLLTVGELATHAVAAFGRVENTMPTRIRWSRN